MRENERMSWAQMGSWENVGEGKAVGCGARTYFPLASGLAFAAHASIYFDRRYFYTHDRAPFGRFAIVTLSAACLSLICACACADSFYKVHHLWPRCKRSITSTSPSTQHAISELSASLVLGLDRSSKSHHSPSGWLRM